MSNIRLSICIPTYNFGGFIGETLKSITDQTDKDVEIIVVDGASTDNTADVVRDFQKRFSNLTYHLLPVKGGVDKDLATAVNLARGDYCWLMSSDDVIKTGAIQRMMKEIESGHDICLCNRTECDGTLTPLRDHPWLAKDVPDKIFTFSTGRDFIKYLNSARSIGALFSYISSIVVKREKWNAVPYDGKMEGSNYAHAARLFSLLQHGGVLKYIREPLVLCRGDNDSFSTSGVVRRFQIDIDGYLFLANTLFADADVRQAFLAVMRREHRWYVFTELKSKIGSLDQWNDLEGKLRQYGYSRVGLIIVRSLGSLDYFMMAARFLWMVLKRIKAQKAHMRAKISRYASRAAPHRG